MATLPKPKLLLPVLVLVALLAFPAVAGATLAYVKNPFNATVYVANDDGSGAKKVDKGHTPRVSPDGQWVAYLHEGPRFAQELKVAPASGGAGTTVMSNFREAFDLAWDPTSSRIAALRGPELGKRKLVVIDVANGKQRVIASGFFSGFSFSPDGREIVYARAGSEKFPPRSDIFRVFVIPELGDRTEQITKDHRSSYPLWSPNSGEIVFVKTVEGKKRRYGPKNELFLMDSRGKSVKRLTHTKVPPLLQGLYPTDWSADGRRLLAEFEGQDTSYAVAINAVAGGQRPVVPGGVGEEFVGTAISSDGTTVLGYNGGFDPASRHEVGIVPWPKTKGFSKPLVKNAFEPSWNR
jgi:Tol biopolymer transport system component